MVTVQSGTSCFFWLDLWNGQVLHQTLPELLSFCKDVNVSVHTIKSAPAVVNLFQLSLSNEAFEQFQHLNTLIQNLQLTSDSDQWRYIWGSNTFSSRKAYRALIESSQVHPIYKWLWKSACQNKRKIFF